MMMANDCVMVEKKIEEMKGDVNKIMMPVYVIHIETYIEIAIDDFLCVTRLL